MSTDLTSVPNVLIVEDEMILRMRAIDIVEDAGFNPVEAVNADQAISISTSRSDISLLFTDIQLPGSVDGLKLAHAVHDRWPSVKIILVSGQVKPSVPGIIDGDSGVSERPCGRHGRGGALAASPAAPARSRSAERGILRPASSATPS